MCTQNIPILPIYLNMKDMHWEQCFTLNSFMAYLNKEFHVHSICFARTPKLDISGTVHCCHYCLELNFMNFTCYQDILFEDDFKDASRFTRAKKIYVCFQNDNTLNLNAFKDTFRSVCTKYLWSVDADLMPQKEHSPYVFLDSMRQYGERQHVGYIYHKNTANEHEKNIVACIEHMQQEFCILEENRCLEGNIYNEAIHGYYASMLQWAESIDYDANKMLPMLFQYVNFLNENGQHEACYTLFATHSRLMVQYWDKSGVSSSTKNTRLGDMHYHLGNYAEALALYEQALESSTCHTSESTHLYNDIGLIHHIQSDYGKALECFEKALHIYQAQAVHEGMCVATTYQNIGRVYATLGNYAKAQEYYALALDIEAHCAFPLPQLATLYNTIGMIYVYESDFPWARAYFEKALTIENADHGLTYYNFSKLLWQQQRITEAKAYALKSLKIREAMYGTKHIVTAQNYTLLGRLFACEDAHRVALQYVRQGLKIREEKLGNSHPSTAESYCAMAYVYEQEGNISAALEYYLQAVSIQEQKLGLQHPSSIETRNKIDNIY